jgi:RNA polymerase sigma factor (sigma-70 family)
MCDGSDDLDPAPVLAFEVFFENERSRLFGALYLMTGNVHEAEDLVQDAFLKVWESWTKVRAMDSPQGYLYRTAMNAFRSRYRRAVRAARRRILSEREEDPFAAADLRDELVRALRDLSPRQRAAVVLVDLLDYRSEEAARLLRVRAATVRNLAAQGRRALRAAMGKADE